ncbi:hypothetical protein KIPB_000585 [Kipferlia bialata]|uniref:Uncharacterized protein n=1 Tax=Kipferlia bialata TaxID=797122 RepID=A0A9K3CNT9_9EUKA|nr:hypothetical protein KIPB_000585 [Kipferlia bialata]|eukprot:g585.t1
MGYISCDSGWPSAPGTWDDQGVIFMSQADMHLGGRGASAFGNRFLLLNGDSTDSCLLMRQSSGVWSLDASYENVQDAVLSGHSMFLTHTDQAILTWHRFDSGSGSTFLESSINFGQAGCSIESVSEARVLISCPNGDLIYLVTIGLADDGTMSLVSGSTAVPATGGAALVGDQVFAADISDDHFGYESGGVSTYDASANLVATGTSIHKPQPNGAGTFGVSIHTSDGYVHIRSAGVDAGRGVALYGSRLIPVAMDRASLTARPGQYISHDTGELYASDGREVYGVFELYTVVDGVYSEVAEWDHATGYYTLSFTAPCTPGTYTLSVLATDCADISLDLSLTVAGDPAPHPSLTTVAHGASDISDVFVFLGGVCQGATYAAESVSVQWDTDTTVVASYDAMAGVYTSSETTPAGYGSHSLSVSLAVDGSQTHEQWQNLPSIGWVQQEVVKAFC